jgi:hypothetical protein
VPICFEEKSYGFRGEFNQRREGSFPPTKFTMILDSNVMKLKYAGKDVITHAFARGGFD